MENCTFCEIVNNKISAEIIYEDLESVAILDVHPRALGHTIVLPRVHAENVLELPNEKVESVFLAVKRVVNLLNNALKPDGFTIGINHGKVSGQTIDHLHIHIIPRWSNDNGGSIHSVVDNPPIETLQEIKNRILNVRS